MANIIITISYKINPEKREEYLSLIGEMKAHVKNMGKNCAVYEDTREENSFSEVFTCSREEEFDEIEDDETIRSLVEKIHSITADEKMKYATMVEVG